MKIIKGNRKKLNNIKEKYIDTTYKTHYIFYDENGNVEYDSDKLPDNYYMPFDLEELEYILKHCKG